MTDFLPFYIGCGFIVVIIIVFNHRKQKSRLNRFVNDGEDAPSILMVQSVERKLKNIYGKLYDKGVKSATSTATGRKQQLINELETLEADYAAKKISLKNYSDKLQQLQLKVSSL